MNLLKLMILSILFFPIMASSEKQKLETLLKTQEGLLKIVEKGLGLTKDNVLTEEEDEKVGNWASNVLAKITDQEVEKMRKTMSLEERAENHMGRLFKAKNEIIDYIAKIRAQITALR